MKDENMKKAFLINGMNYLSHAITQLMCCDLLSEIEHEHLSVIIQERKKLIGLFESRGLNYKSHLKEVI